ncbi:MAG: serine/threonine-protein kinase [Archangium sp.]|nr:serine/threonine-protein kinase [Archangium sp.]
MTEELERGSRLGKYEIHGRLSSGGMAELYLASLAGQGGFRKFVALKRVLPSIAQDESFTRMFLDEARITAALSRAAIAQVYELAEDPQTHEPVLAMEFIAGQNLEQIIKRARARAIPLPEEFTCRLAHDVLIALQSAHSFVDPATGKSMEVVHRDINPRNVMVTYAGGTKIVDFGIARARGRLHQTQAGFVKGTLQYMAPEQVTAKAVDGRTDLFAASILFYELLAGCRLFDAPSEIETMTRVASSDVPDLAQLAPWLPPELTAAVMKGLACLPEQRWQTAREYARAVDRALPEAFDDQQMADLMGRLFEDKIEVTRSMLSSGAQATVADLRLITRRGDSDTQVEPPVEITAPGRRPGSSDLTELNLEPVSTRQVETPSWVYVLGAITGLAGLVLIAMLVLILAPAR